MGVHSAGKVWYPRLPCSTFLVPCDRLSWLALSFWVHINIAYPVVLYQLVLCRSSFFFRVFWKRTSVHGSGMVFLCAVPFLSPNKQCQSTKWKTLRRFLMQFILCVHCRRSVAEEVKDWVVAASRQTERSMDVAFGHHWLLRGTFCSKLTRSLFTREHFFRYYDAWHTVQIISGVWRRILHCVCYVLLPRDAMLARY